LKDVVVNGASMGRQIGFHVTVLMTSVLGIIGRLIDGSRGGGSLTGRGVLLFKNRDGPVLYSNVFGISYFVFVVYSLWAKILGYGI
jgi:hypothetical protein